ncbi:hypothetical protein B5X24_HaOG208950 [Helicoverpa armigera]|uniref:Uncharacterized protein n=1 Tax=Helicoverpa armigera TaxID=29058 RepID=A0A2W1BLJ0_HELAM|nr:hypothetical protein B5X24_HaOG208950 [Helicoverpa armigera]
MKRTYCREWSRFVEAVEELSRMWCGAAAVSQIARDAAGAALCAVMCPAPQTLVIAPLFKNVVVAARRGMCGDNARRQRPLAAEATHFQPGNVRPRLKGPPPAIYNRAGRAWGASCNQLISEPIPLPAWPRETIYCQAKIKPITLNRDMRRTSLAPCRL